MRPARLLTLALLGVAGLIADQTTPIAALSCGGGQAQAQNLFPGEEAICYGRVYDQAHMARRPQQKVTSLYVWRSVEDRKEAENYTPRKKDQAEGFGVDAYVTFRDRRGQFHNSLWCGDGTSDNPKQARCYIDCDGGSFVMEREAGNSVLLRNNGFVLIGGCGSDVEESKTVFFDPGADDKVFRLERKDPSVCRAEEQKAKPLRLGFGKPLRERFKPDETFCLGRDYDAAHLGKNPQQRVASIRVGRLEPNKEPEAQAGPSGEPESGFPFGVKLAVSLKLKGANAARSVRYECSPTESSWECDSEAADGAPSTCDNRKIHLARGPGDDVFLINRKDGLPIDAACGPRDPNKETTTRDTRSDDKSFRLKRMPVEACR